MTTRDQGIATPEALAAQLVGLLAVQDLEGVVGLYAHDAVVSLANGREAAGTAAIRRAFGAALATGTGLGVHAAIEPRVVVAGSLAMTSFTGRDGGVRTLVARRATDGTWLWVRDGSTLRHVTVAEVRVREVDFAVPA
jgi:ketosteroid isomerase-like protein